MVVRTDDLWHIVGSVLVPVLLIVLIPVLAAIWVSDRNQHEQLRQAQIASCERGNAIRVVLGVLAESQLDDLEAASTHAASENVRARDADLYRQLKTTLEDPGLSPLLRQVRCE